MKNEQFHQDIAKIKQLYQGKYYPAMMGHYRWFVVGEREDDTTPKRIKYP